MAFTGCAHLLRCRYERALRFCNNNRRQSRRARGGMPLVSNFSQSIAFRGHGPSGFDALFMNTHFGHRQPYFHRGLCMKQKQVKELLIQSLEHERGGIKVYETALKCVNNDDLKEEWEKYLEQTRNHERILTNVFQKLGFDPEEESPGRQVVKLVGGSLVQAMTMALKAGDPAAAELVACECQGSRGLGTDLQMRGKIQRQAAERVANGRG
jgi:hypothetical protein